MKTTFASITSTAAIVAACAMSANALAVPHMEKRIIGGYDLPGDAAPFAVHLEFTGTKGSFVCGGTVITPKHVLTAAHCVFTEDGHLYLPSNTTVGYGDDSLTKQKVIRPTKLIPHPEYSAATATTRGVNDIAIIEVEGFDATLNVGTLPIYAGAVPAGQELVALGWGTTVSNNDPHTLPDTLKGAQLHVGDAEGCQVYDPDYTSSDGPRICTLNKYNPGTSTCKGDSGTGVVIVSDSKVYLAGLDSEGGRVNNDPTCGTADGYTLFTHVYNQLAFIMQYTGYPLEYLTRS
ncbi:hypothetical protein EV174_003031 [Coemansia sp. RSA 2320]|nr:hypothetical protein EV174_003031 [Coemansia sp. RSA 2320]